MFSFVKRGSQPDWGRAFGDVGTEPPAPMPCNCLTGNPVYNADGTCGCSEQIPTDTGGIKQAPTLPNPDADTAAKPVPADYTFRVINGNTYFWKDGRWNLNQNRRRRRENRRNDESTDESSGDWLQKNWLIIATVVLGGLVIINLSEKKK